MNCEDVQGLLHDSRKRRLDDALHAEVRAHVESCATCAGADRAERALDALLEERLPRHAAPTALKQRLGRLIAPTPPPAAARGQRALKVWARFIAPAMAAGFALMVGRELVQRSSTQESALVSLTSEAVNDHLRVLASQHPLDIASGGQHQVKPWFEGKLDFAPEVPALDDTELQLRGGSVGYVFDRKAAVLVYALRQHVVTLLVLRAEGLDWPSASAGQSGPVRGQRTSRGFNVVLWRSGELGYALVSDANAKELGELAARLAAATRPAGP